jgi:hypothetical protein
MDALLFILFLLTAIGGVAVGFLAGYSYRGRRVFHSRKS